MKEIIYTKEEVSQSTLGYFQGNDLATSSVLKKYLHQDLEGNYLDLNPDAIHRRIAKELARIESKYPNPLSENLIYSYLKDFSQILAQGSPISAIGNKYHIQSTSNCFVGSGVTDKTDSYGGILQADQEIVQIAKRRGGIGQDISGIRPRGAVTRNAAKTSDGIGVFMERFSNTTNEVAQCIQEDQRVIVKGKGLTAIKDVQVNDFVHTKVGWVKVLNTLKNTKDVYKIRSNFGFEIQTSLDHVFLTLENEVIMEKPIKDIKLGDSLVLLNGLGTDKPYLTLTHSNFTKTVVANKNALGIYEGSHVANRYKDVTIPEVLDEKLAYLLGFSVGDGCVEYDRKGNKANLLVACEHKRPELKTKIINYASTLFNCEISFSKAGGACDKISIGNKEVVSFLQENSLLKAKAEFVSIPELIFSSPVSVQCAFLSGLFDADGYASGSKKGYVFTTVSETLAKDIQTLLMSIGVLSKIKTEDRTHIKSNWKTLYSVVIVGAVNQYKFISLMSESIKVNEKPHISKRDNYMSPYTAKSLGIKRTKKHNNISMEGLLSINVLESLPQIREAITTVDTLKSLDLVGESITYDLVLESEHLFWCEGFYVHNSGRRGALMLSLHIDHPDSPIFATIKNDDKKVTGANISLRLTKTFLNAVKMEQDYYLRFPVTAKVPENIEQENLPYNELIKKGETYFKRIKAKELWDTIIHSAWLRAEPGLLFWDNIIENSPTSVYKNFISTSTNPSLRQDTKVLTDKGVFPIKWLADNLPNPKVMNVLGEWQECKVFKSGINKQLVEIVFTHGQKVYCTKEHKWLILNSLNNISNSYTGKTIKKEALNLKRGDKIPLLFNPAPINNSDCTFNEDDGFVLGWNLGDGWITYHKLNKTPQLGFCFSEEDLVSGIGDFVLDYTNKLSKKASTLKQDHKSKCYSYCTTDINVLSKFEGMRYCKKSEGIPKSVWEGNSEFIRGFIDGLFSSDGYVDINTFTLTLTSSHKNLIEDVQKLLNFYGIKSNICKQSTKSNFKKFPDKIYTRYDLDIRGNFVQKFGKLFTLSNINKQTKLDKLLYVKLKEHTNKYKNRNKDYSVIKEVNLTDIYEDVYDITVYDDTHTFLMESGITGNCAELPLSPYDSCRLFVVNLCYFVKNKFTTDSYFDFNEYLDVVHVAQRLMDDLIDLELEAIDKILEKITNDPEDWSIKKAEFELWQKVRQSCNDGRRTGLGITGLGDVLAMLGVTYGSKQAIDITENIYKHLAKGSYESSIKLASERGSFPAYNYELEKDHKWLNGIIDILDTEYQEMYKQTGRRNIACNTTAPTGTTSMTALLGVFNSVKYFGTTSGIEPLFLIGYDRRTKIMSDSQETPDFIDDLGVKWKSYTVYHTGVNLYNAIKESNTAAFVNNPYIGSTSADINWVDSVKLQGQAQKWVDHSISKTVNLPSDATEELIAEVYMTAYESGCKGITVYRSGCRSGVLISNDPKDTPEVLPETHAPKRPKKVKAEIHFSHLDKAKWLMIVGLYGNKPYELFGGIIPDDLNIPKNIKEGYLVKVKSGHYDLLDTEDNVLIKDITNTLPNTAYNFHTRFISATLRHGFSVQYLIDQLNHLSDKELGLFTFNKVAIRVLKKFIPNGTKAKTNSGCPECGSTTLIYQEGCVSCSCGFSRC